MTSEFLQARITKTQEQIVAVEAAIDAILVQGFTSYSFDTGQTRQSVTKQDLPRLNEMLDALVNRLATYEARADGSGTTHGAPSW